MLTSSVVVQRILECSHALYVCIKCCSAHKFCRHIKNIGMPTSSVGVHRLWECLHAVYVYLDCGSAYKLCRCTENIEVLTLCRHT